MVTHDILAKPDVIASKVRSAFDINAVRRLFVGHEFKSYKYDLHTIELRHFY